MFRILLCASLLAPSVAAAQQVDCKAIYPVGESHAALSKLYADMARWCIDGDMTQPACLKLHELSEEHQVSPKQSEAALSFFLMARQCPDE